MYKKKVANLCVVLLALIVFWGLFQAREQLNKRFSDIEYIIQPAENQVLKQHEIDSNKANDKFNDWIALYKNKIIGYIKKNSNGWDVAILKTLNENQ